MFEIAFGQHSIKWESKGKFNRFDKWRSKQHMCSKQVLGYKRYGHCFLDTWQPLTNNYSRSPVVLI